jgi:hypothetical protein
VGVGGAAEDRNEGEEEAEGELELFDDEEAEGLAAGVLGSSGVSRMCRTKQVRIRGEEGKGDLKTFPV